MNFALKKDFLILDKEKKLRGTLLFKSNYMDKLSHYYYCNKATKNT